MTVDPITVSILLAIISAASAVLVPLIAIAGPILINEAANALAPAELRNPDGTKPPLDKPVTKPNTTEQTAVQKGEENDLLMYLGAGALLVTGVWLAFFRKKG